MGDNLEKRNSETLIVPLTGQDSPADKQAAEMTDIPTAALYPVGEVEAQTAAEGFFPEAA